MYGDYDEWNAATPPQAAPPLSVEEEIASSYNAYAPEEADLASPLGVPPVAGGASSPAASIPPEMSLSQDRDEKHVASVLPKEMPNREAEEKTPAREKEPPVEGKPVVGAKHAEATPVANEEIASAGQEEHKVESAEVEKGEDKDITCSPELDPPTEGDDAGGAVLPSPPAHVLDDIFTKLDVNGNTQLEKEEVVKGAALLNMTPEEAAAAFDQLDTDGSGALSRQEFEHGKGVPATPPPPHTLGDISSKDGAAGAANDGSNDEDSDAEGEGGGDP